MKLFKTAIICLAVAGCDASMSNFPLSTTGASSKAPLGDGEAVTCGAGDVRHFVGEPKAVLQNVTLPENTRILGETDAMTLDYNPNRLNIITSSKGIIMKVYCG